MKNTIKVIMLVNTAYGGQRFHINSEVDVPEEVGHRWVKRGIARPAVIEEAPAHTGASGDDFSKMTAKQLYELCVSKEIETAPRLSKDHYIKLLTQEG